MSNKFTDFSRIMDMKSDTLWDRRKWGNKDPLRQFYTNYCHWGQLKLFYSELEFITICMERDIALNESCVVYVGAAPGTHTIYLHKLFPELHWLLYDPNKFHIQESNNINIYTGKQGFFTDDSIESVLNHPFVKKSKYLLFISDIRAALGEMPIFEEMQAQQRWLLKLNADVSMLKFRLPYTIEGENSLWTYDIESIKKYIKFPPGRPPCITKPNNMCYLRGEIYMQIYPPSFSTETRLIVDKKRDKFKMFNYDTIKYEEKCFYYNLFIRNAIMEYKQSNQISQHILGIFDCTHETCSQYYIVESYLKHKGLSVDVKNICNFIYDIVMFHNNINTTVGVHRINRSLVNCQLLSVNNEKLKYYMEMKELNVEQVKNYQIKTKDLYESICKKTDAQINYFSNGTVLERFKYEKQIGILLQSKSSNKILFENIYNTLEKKINEMESA
jgi:hypothetical protein